MTPRPSSHAPLQPLQVSLEYSESNLIEFVFDLYKGDKKKTVSHVLFYRIRKNKYLVSVPGLITAEDFARVFIDTISIGSRGYYLNSSYNATHASQRNTLIPVSLLEHDKR